MYMAPEFFTGENPSYGRSIDVFAMGMLFLTMLQAEHGKPLLSPRTGRFNYVFSNFCWTYIWFKSSRTDTFYFIYQIWLQDTISNSSNPLVFSYLEDVSGAMSKFPIGMRMCMAHATHGQPIKLVEIKASDHHASSKSRDSYLRCVNPIHTRDQKRQASLMLLDSA